METWKETFNKDQDIKYNTELYILLLQFNSVDVWRNKNPGMRDYTYYPARHNTFTRIDVSFYIS